jgi:pimeloyl-ACP methyl ester carboxylesterase
MPAVSEAESVVSRDGTRIGLTRSGAGAPLVMVAGVMASRERPQQPGLAQALAAHWTVYTYDRRGTGTSADTDPYAVGGEFDDLQAVLDRAGGEALVYGFSSGATLALLAARAGVRGKRMILVEPPLVPDRDDSVKAEAERRLTQDRGAARRWFDEHVTGIPAHVLANFPPLAQQDLDNTPAMLHELSFLPGTRADLFADVQVPALVVASDHTAPSLLEAAQQLAAVMPHATLQILAGSGMACRRTRW